MSETIGISGLDLALVLGRGLLILALLRLLGWLVELAPMPRSRKEMLQAVGPVFAVAVCLAYLFLAVQEIFGRYEAAMPLLLGTVLVGFAAALWAPIRDLLAGVSLKSGRVIRVGDEVQLGDVHGRIERLLYRRMVVRTAQGEAILPYGLVSRSAIMRSSGTTGSVSHTFRVRPIDGVSLVELRQQVRESALLCHWASLVREPELLNLSEGGLEVTVFCVDREYAPEVEGAVRRSLAALGERHAASALHRISQRPARPDAQEPGGAGGTS